MLRSVKQSIFCACPSKNNRNKTARKGAEESLFTGTTQGLPGGSVVQNLPVNTGGLGLMPGSRRSSGEGNGNRCSIFAWEIHGQRSLGG